MPRRPAPGQLHALDPDRPARAGCAQFGFDVLADGVEFDRPLAEPPPSDPETDRERRDQSEQNLDSNERRAADHPAELQRPSQVSSAM